MELLVIFLTILHTVIAEVQQQVLYSIEEEVPIGTSVGNFGIDSRLRDTYPDAYEELEYSINSQSPSDLFIIDSAGPVLKTRTQVDRDAICPNKETCLTEVNIRVGPLRYFHLIQVVVEIIDLNDNVPQFDTPRVEVTLPESSQVGSRIPIQTASDPDSPTNAVRRYALEDPSSTFRIQVLNTSATDVELYLTLSRELDREVEDEYELKLLAFDGYGPSAHSGSVLIDVLVQDVNDNNPVFQRSSYEFAMDEPVQSNTLIGIVRAEDGDIGANAIIVYTIQGSVPFRVNSSTGEIYATNLLDREFQSNYVFVVKASNSGGFSLPGSTKVTVTINDINDNSPVIDVQESTTAEVEENSGAGAYVAHLIVTDADEGENGEFSCALNYNEFKLTKLFGSQYKIITTTSLNRELIPSYNLVIKCEDNGQPRLMTEKSLIVRVLDLNDNAPKFSQLVYLTDLPENSDPGASVFTAYASDPDEGMNGNVLYSLMDTVDASNFTINSVSGVIKTRVSFDREQVTRLKVIIVASDQAINSQMSSSATVLVDITDINDEIPTFLEDAYTFAVYENQAPGTQVGQVYAVDRDEEPFNDFVFSFISNDDNDSTSLPFEMDPYSGKVWTTRSLDRETRAEYTLTAFATTIGSTSGEDDPPYSTAEVHIYIADKNDQPPVLHFPSEYNNTVHVASLPKGEFVTAINATDRDSGTNALLSYFLSGKDSFMFQVDESNGEILTRVDLDKYDQHAFIITVVVRDHGDPPMSAQSTMTIVVNSTIPYVPMARHSSRQNLTIVIVIVCLSSFAMIILLTGIAIVWVMHRRASKRHKMSVLRGRLIIAQREAKEIDSISDLEIRTPDHQLQTNERQTHEDGNLGMFKIRKKSGNKEESVESHPRPPRVPDKVEKRKVISQNSRGPDADLLDCCSSGGNSENSDVTDSGRGSCDDGTIQSRHPLLQTPKKKPGPLRRAASDAPPSLPPRTKSLSKADRNQSASSHHSNSHSLPRTPQRTFTNQDLPEPIYPTPGGTVYSTPSPVNPKLLKILQSTPKGKYKVDSNLTEHGSYV